MSFVHTYLQDTGNVIFATICIFLLGYITASWILLLQLNAALRRRRARESDPECRPLLEHKDFPVVENPPEPENDDICYRTAENEECYCAWCEDMDRNICKYDYAGYCECDNCMKYVEEEENPVEKGE